MPSEKRMLLEEVKNFMRSVPEGSWAGRPQWREDLISRIDATIDADAEHEEMMGGIRGMFSKWLGKRQ